jgi:hypothetical protein
MRLGSTQMPPRGAHLRGPEHGGESMFDSHDALELLEEQSQTLRDMLGLLEQQRRRILAQDEILVSLGFDPLDLMASAE